jgi:UDP-glucose:(heptosyl)LPS alpha-1,3-glucosyltransferase
MKIGFVRRGYSSTGGAEAYLLRLANAVAAEGHTPMLVTSREWPEAAWPNDLVVRLNATTPLDFAKEVERLKVDWDVLFSLERIFSCDIYRAGDGVHRAWLERRAAFEPSLRRCFRWMNGKHRSLLKLEGNLFSQNGAGCVIANSEMVRQEIARNYKYPADRIEVIPNGYDAPPYSAVLRAERRTELRIDSNAFVALFAGSGWERKGLRAAVAAAQAVPGMTLLVAGRGNSAAYSGARNIHFLGARADLQPDFAAADVFILPTIYDPFSNACLEAWASGLPVITTSANGFSEVLTDGVDGSIVSPGDIDALVETLKFWSADGKVAAIGNICRERAMHYSVQENTRRTLDLIKRAMRQ